MHRLLTYVPGKAEATNQTIIICHLPVCTHTHTNTNTVTHSQTHRDTHAQIEQISNQCTYCASVCTEQPCCPLPLHAAQDKAVEILSQHMCTDLPTSFGHSFINLCGYEISKVAAKRCFSDARMTIHDVDVLELHDCFAPNEVSIGCPQPHLVVDDCSLSAIHCMYSFIYMQLFLYEALGMCPVGCGGKLIDDAKWIQNSKGPKFPKMPVRSAVVTF